MSGSFTLVLLILGSAVLVFFAEEFVNAFKSFFSIFIVRMCFFPLLLTIIMLNATSQTTMILQWFFNIYVLIVQGVMRFLPKYHFLTMLCSGIAVSILSVLPGWILEASSVRRNYVSSPYAFCVMLCIWITLSVLVVLS